VAFLRSKTVTAVDLLSMDVGAVMEQASYRGIVGVGTSKFRPGYQLKLNRRSVVVYYLNERGGDDLAQAQHAFAQRVGPMLVAKFGGGRVRTTTIMGIGQGFEITLK
jgi:hypothetical protein